MRPTGVVPFFCWIASAWEPIGDGCSRDGQGFLGAASSCATDPHYSSAVGLATLRQDCFAYGFVHAGVNYSIGEYINETLTYLVSLADIYGARLNSPQLRQLREPSRCFLCIHHACLGDDIAIRTYLLSFRAGLGPSDAILGLPAIWPSQYKWTEVDDAASLGIEVILPAKNRRALETANFNDGSSFRVAFVSRAQIPALGGSYRLAAATRAHFRAVWDEVSPDAVWRLPFSRLERMDSAGQVLEEWWSDTALPYLGWIFGWRADVLLIYTRTQRALDYVSKEYDALVFLGAPSDVQVLPYLPGQGPVRLHMPYEPFWLLNMALGDDDDAKGRQSQPMSPHRRLWGYFKRNGICPAVLDQYDLPWVVNEGVYPVVEDKDFDPRLNVRQSRVSTFPKGVHELAPALLAPQSHRWHLPLYRHFRVAASVSGRLRRLHGQGMVMVDPYFSNKSTVEWMKQELTRRGFKVIFVNAFRRHGRNIYHQPRALMRSIFEDHIPELANTQYLVHVTPKASAGQLVAEASLLGVLTLASPHKMLSRLLLPPELHAKTLSEALSKIDELEASPARAQMLRSIVRGRAERIVGNTGAPPIHSYLEVLSASKSRGMSRESIRALCAPPNASAQAPRTAKTDAKAIRFWRFAAGRSCSWERSRSAGEDRKVPSPSACAERCQATGATVFEYDEGSRVCSVFHHCVLAAPRTWSADVFVMNPGRPLGRIIDLA
eukprot:TRINITY_DN13225_c0_g1_i2.p1 TRINITY_DN13225_c0_g1~~TRINITY_DN13225_c0_g1_i2.p1  ORF type:complete len:719 (-),score=63.80 TRINITY_DN13225_c0_g1_i2:129-2285(-)